MSNPIKYTSRDFNTILQDINAQTDLVDKPEWFKRLIAGVGDTISMINNVTANQNYLPTAQSRQAVSDLCQLIDYEIPPQTTASGYLQFHLSPAISTPITLNASVLTAQSPGSTAVSSKRFESRTNASITALRTNTFTYVSTSLLQLASSTPAIPYNGTKVRFTTSGTLPTGLSTGTDYYLKNHTVANQFYVYSSLANLQADIKVSITGAGSGTHTVTYYAVEVLCYQQETKTNVSVGQTDGVTEFQTFTLPDKFILKDTIQITVGVDSYTQVSTLVFSTASDKHYKVKTLSDNLLAIQFGNGDYGILPPANTITATYAVGGGVISNVTQTISGVNLYNGGSANITGVINGSTMTGGQDEQGIESAKVIAPLLLKARDRFVTADDGVGLALAYGGLSLVQVNPNVYGILTAQVVAVATGGGSPNLATRNAIASYLQERTVLGYPTVTFDEADLVDQTVTIAIQIKSGYLFANVQPYAVLACKLFFTETSKEIIDTYNDYGIDAVITKINTFFGTSFTKITDGNQITNLMAGLNLLGTRTFGETIPSTDFITFIEGFVYGVDSLTITSPTFPISLGNTEITTTTGSPTVTEIV